MRKIRGLLLAVCVASAALCGGCGKAGQESDAQDDIRQETGETVSDEESDRAGQTGETESSSETGQSGQEEQSVESDQGQQDSGIAFEAKDLEGNTVTESVFADSELTMVNVWATYCNPCLSEMPDLGELAGEYDGEQFQIIGIISDVLENADEGNKEYAAALVAQTGADYSHLLLNESVYIALLTDVSAVPTTFFIDGSGEVLDTMVGARNKESWKEIIDELLEK